MQSAEASILVKSAPYSKRPCNSGWKLGSLVIVPPVSGTIRLRIPEVEVPDPQVRWFWKLVVGSSM